MPIITSIHTVEEGDIMDIMDEVTLSLRKNTKEATMTPHTTPHNDRTSHALNTSPGYAFYSFKPGPLALPSLPI